MKRIVFGIIAFGVMAFAGQFEDGRKVFESTCTDCHVGHIATDKIKDNFFKKKNSVYMLTSPSVNMIADAIMNGAKHIGKSSDPNRQTAIAKYLTKVLEHPKREESICDPEILKYYDEKKPLATRLSGTQIASLARYFMEYEKRRNQVPPPSSKMLTKKYNAVNLLAEAHASNKRIIVEASSTHCPWCKKMKEEVLQSEDVQQVLSEGYVFVDVNIDKIALPFGLKKKFKQITPTFFILESDGSFVARHPGSWGKEDFINILKEYAPKK